MNYSTLIRVVLISLSVSACALPSEVPELSFTPRRELVAVQRAREGIYALSVNRYEEAEMKLRQALFLAPDADNLKLNLIAALEGAEQFDEAKTLLAHYLKKDPASLDYKLRDAHIAASERRYDDALGEYKEILTLQETKSNWDAAGKTARNLRIITHEIGRNEEALCYSGVAAAYIDSLDSAIEHARFMISQNLSDVALSYITSFGEVRGFSTNATLLHTQALAAAGAEQWKDAWEYEDRALELGSLETDLLREAHILRAVASDTPEVAPNVAEDDREDIEKEWKKIESSVTLESIANSGWPIVVMDAALNRTKKET